MTPNVIRILKEVEQLSPPDRQELCCATAERIPISDDLTDDDFAVLPADMLRVLDEEETQRDA